MSLSSEQLEFCVGALKGGPAIYILDRLGDGRLYQLYFFSIKNQSCHSIVCSISPISAAAFP